MGIVLEQLTTGLSIIVSTCAAWLAFGGGAAAHHEQSHLFLLLFLLQLVLVGSLAGPCAMTIIRKVSGVLMKVLWRFVVMMAAQRLREELRRVGIAALVGSVVLAAIGAAAYHAPL